MKHSAHLNFIAHGSYCVAVFGSVGVQVLPGTTVKEVQCADGKVKVTTSKDEKVRDTLNTFNLASYSMQFTVAMVTQLEVDHVVVAVGLLPNTNLASSAGLETDPLLGGYRVNAELQACTDVWVVSTSLNIGSILFTLYHKSVFVIQ